ncbi:Histone-lysine N-methyltransferase SMYD3 [Geodia barretti]|uniref:Histone-lysine N-methyltransferase SMYD3 n=2 Tax=Geodia barretti TaxID=519541 RepID=A0AA35S6K4_GEOBA|nr:Histone-lysine N-methyltransferase SMYD3 [Geodia barretti]
MAAQQDEREQAPGRPRVRRWWQDNGICPPLAVKEKEGRGGGVFTTEDLKCGTEVLPPIAPLACALMSDVRGCYCDYCFKSVEDCGKPLRRCSRCRFAYYCSKACQESDWRSHKHECRVTISKAWLSVMMRLVLRCMHIQGKQKQELDLLRASDDNLLSEGASKDTQNCIHGVLGFLDTDDPATKKKIVDIAYKITFNGFSIHEDELRPIGVGLYTCLSLFNHSCVPNCAAVSDGRKLVVRTVADIKAGEQLVVSYLDPFDTPEQRKLKLTEYGFECDCEMCNTELYPDSPFRALEAGLEGSSPDEVRVAVERGVESLKRAKYLMDMDDWRRALVEIGSSLSRQAGILHCMHNVTLTTQEQLYYAYMGAICQSTTPCWDHMCFGWGHFCFNWASFLRTVINFPSVSLFLPRVLSI